MDAIKINSLLECGMCLDIFDDPRNLPCGHTFCFNCIKKSVDTDKDRRPSCALCRASWSVPDEGLQGVMKNFVLSNFVKSIGQQGDTAIKCALVDDGDEHGTAEYFCIDCWDPLCADCSKVHKKTRNSKNHDVKKMIDVTDVDVQRHKKKEEAQCTKHNDKILEYYCNECKCAVCVACCVTSHFQHRCEGLNEVDGKFINRIKREIEEVIKLEISYNTQLDIAEQAQIELDNEYKQKLSELKLNISKTRQENQKCFALIMERIDKHEHDVEDNLSKLKKEEAVRLKSIVTDIKEKLAVEKQKRLTNEQYLSPVSSVFQRAEAYAQLSEAIGVERKCDILVAKIKLPPIQTLKCKTSISNKATVANLKYVNSLVVINVMSDTNGITALSVNDNGLLVSSYNNKQVYIYSKDGHQLTNFTVAVDILWSVTWLNNHQLICTSANCNNSVIMSEANDYKTILTTFNHGVHVYVSKNKPNVLYSSDLTKSLFKSEDAGKTWSTVFNIPTNYKLYQALPINDNNKEKQVFWTLILISCKYSLQECVIDKQGLTTWREIKMTTQSGKSMQIGNKSMMVYDENDTIFVSCPEENAVLAFSVASGKQIDSLSVIKELDYPSGLALDKKGSLLYVGNKGGIIKVYEVEEVARQTSVEILLREDVL